jgi:hypothetical protein
MSSPKDPLLDTEAPDRAYYATGVLLDTADFVAEQTYHRGRLARALATLHGVGTAAGLKVEYRAYNNKPVESELVVHPGLALDPLGRLVEVPSEACIRIKRWYESQPKEKLKKRSKDRFKVEVPQPTDTRPAIAVVADLFLRFRTYERGWTPAMASGLYDATDAVTPARLRDGYELRLVPRHEEAENEDLPTVPVGPWPYPLGKPEKNLWPAPNDQDRTRKLKKAILDSWHEGRPALLDALRNERAFLPPELRVDASQPDGNEVDPAWVFLARVMIAVHATNFEEGPDGIERPARTGDVYVDNTMRPFAVTVAALSRWLGI